jgi:hypothetical protein
MLLGRAGLSPHPLGVAYSPNVAVREFCELRLMGILGSSAKRSSAKFAYIGFCELRHDGVRELPRTTPPRNGCRNAWETVVS